MPYLEDDTIIKSLNDEVAKIARASFGENTVVLSEMPERINRRYSFMFRYQLQKGNGEKLFLLAKIPHQSWMATIEEAVVSEQLREEVQFEYRVMQSIAQVIANSGESQLTAINPLGCIVEWNAGVTEEIRLVMLKDYLLKIPIILGLQTAWVDFENILELAGRWLRVIHESFSTGSRTELKSLDVYPRIQEELSLLENKNIRKINLLKNKFSDVYKLVAEQEVLLSSTHDDYHLGNIFVTPEGKVGALDPNWKENRSIFEDLSKLIIDPSTRKMQVISQGLTFRSSLRKRFENKILRGYFGESTVPYSILWFYCALACLEKWRINEEMLASRKSLLFSFLKPGLLWVIRRYFSGLIQTYLKKVALPGLSN